MSTRRVDGAPDLMHVPGLGIGALARQGDAADGDLGLGLDGGLGLRRTVPVTPGEHALVPGEGFEELIPSVE
jgi:hypothetical protein